VGWERELAAYLADAIMPQTVAVSPTWPGASSGLRVVAAPAEATQMPNTADTRANLWARAALNTVVNQGIFIQIGSDTLRMNSFCCCTMLLY
jgi:hypothetical protein